MTDGDVCVPAVTTFSDGTVTFLASSKYRIGDQNCEDWTR